MPRLPGTLPLVVMTTLLLLVCLPASLVYANTNHFQAKTRIVVDRSGFLKWKTATGKSTTDEVKQEIRSNFVDVTDIFTSLQRFQPRMSFGFEILDIQVLSNDILPKEALDSPSLKAFLKWTGRQGKVFDVYLLYTGRDLVFQTKAPHGIAYLSRICSETSVAIIELTSWYLDPLSIAHEIAHLFGSRHDGDTETSACPGDDGYLMASYIHRENPNHFKFSKCTYDMIYNTLVTVGNGTCMKDGDASKVVTGPRRGSFITADDQCRRNFGKKSEVDRKHHFNTHGDELCTKLKCVTKEKEKFTSTSQGLSCGKSKRCILGKCVKTADGDSKVLDSCPLGDQPGVVFKSRDKQQFTCATLPKGACFNFRAECCQSCSKLKLSEPDEICKRLQGPKSSLARDTYTKWGDELCQKLHCLEHFGNAWYSKAFDTPEGMQCGKNKVCKNKKCVLANSASDKGDPHMPDYCPYGDQPWIPGGYQTTCPQFDQVWGCTRISTKACCETCIRDEYVPVLPKSAADDVCRQAKGDGWSFNRGYYKNYEDMCTNFQCVTVRGNSLVGATVKAPNGLTCDNRKVCYNGKCRRATKGDPDSRGHCPAYDHPFKTLADDGTVISCQDNINCRDASVKRWCCRKCEGW